VEDIELVKLNVKQVEGVKEEEGLEEGELVLVTDWLGVEEGVGVEELVGVGELENCVSCQSMEEASQDPARGNKSTL